MWMEWDESKKQNLLFQLLDSPKDTNSRLVPHEPSICSAIMASHAGSESDPAIAWTSIRHFLLWCISHSAEVIWLCTFDTLLAIWCRQNCDTIWFLQLPNVQFGFRSGTIELWNYDFDLPPFLHVESKERVETRRCIGNYFWIGFQLK